MACGALWAAVSSGRWRRSARALAQPCTSVPQPLHRRPVLPRTRLPLHARAPQPGLSRGFPPRRPLACVRGPPKIALGEGGQSHRPGKPAPARPPPRSGEGLGSPGTGEPPLTVPARLCRPTSGLWVPPASPRPTGHPPPPGWLAALSPAPLSARASLPGPGSGPAPGLSLPSGSSGLAGPAPPAHMTSLPTTHTLMHTQPSRM